MGRRRHSPEEKLHHQLFCPGCGFRLRVVQKKPPVRGCPYSTCTRFKVPCFRYTNITQQTWMFPFRLGKPLTPKGAGRGGI